MKSPLPLTLAVVALAALLVLAVRSQRTLAGSLPPVRDFATQAEAFGALLAEREPGETFAAVLGTGSMRPYIPAAAAGRDPLTTVVAYVVLRPRHNAGTFEAIHAGALVSYHPEQAPEQVWLHVAATRDAHGWVMSGLANAHSESWQRVTVANFVGIVARTYTWPQPIGSPAMTP